MKIRLAGTYLAPVRSAMACNRPYSTRLSPTEERHPLSMRLDEMPLEKSVSLMLREEARVAKILLEHRHRLARAIRIIATSLRQGGRLIYAGAGSSGRLGALDASECPPTFRAPRGQVQAVIAGGKKALWRSVEGAEDDARAGRREMARLTVDRRDIVVGIAASGTTPFVWGALREAKRRGAGTILVCFNPYVRISRAWRPRLVLAPNLGAEVLTGSTRLKCGTATKLILNLFSTLAMVQLGKVRSNLMIDLKPVNAKLRARAVRIVRELTQWPEAQAQRALEASGWNIKNATIGSPARTLARNQGTFRRGKTRRILR